MGDVCTPELGGGEWITLAHVLQGESHRGGRGEAGTAGNCQVTQGDGVYGSDHEVTLLTVALGSRHERMVRSDRKGHVMPVETLSRISDSWASEEQQGVGHRHGPGAQVAVKGNSKTSHAPGQELTFQVRALKANWVSAPELTFTLAPGLALEWGHRLRRSMLIGSLEGEPRPIPSGTFRQELARKDL